MAKSVDEELAYEYLVCRAQGTIADRIGYWYWLYRNHPQSVYRKVAARV